jgi:site-specific DNA-methyltransferase (adenine-specific)
MTNTTKAAKLSANKQKPIERFTGKIICGDTLKILRTLPDESVDCVITSPPYWALRNYNVEGQIGLEPTIEEYLEKLANVFREIYRVLKPEGTAWVNFGDTYANKTKGGQKNKPQHNIFDSLNRRATFAQLKPNLNIRPKSLCLIPSRFALQMIEAGWILRNEIIWHKSNVMPQSFRDRFTVDFEKLFFFTKSGKYFFDQQFEPLKNPERLKKPYRNPNNFHKWQNADKTLPINHEAMERSRPRVLKTGRNKRCVWSIGTSQFKGEHFAVFPERLVETPVKAGCPDGGIVLDPFMGSGTTAVVARRLGKQFIGIDLNPDYVTLAEQRLSQMEMKPANNW